MKCKFKVIAAACIVQYIILNAHVGAYCACDIIIVCISCGMLPTLVAIILLLALDYAIQL